MPLTRFARRLREMWAVPRDLLLGRYPPFVTGGPLPRGHVPVFVFHSLDPRVFEPKLRHLADNGYLTLSAGEYWEVLQGTRAAPEKAVVLTFDDGRGSVYSVGGPLLRRYGMKGIVFLVPGRMASRPGPLPPTWDDGVAGRVAPEVVLDRESGDGAFLSWEEVESLARSGVVEFHSHTLTHGRIHTSGAPAGFLHPELRRGHAPLDVPLVFNDDDGRDLFAGQAPLGTPLFHSAPRTSESLRFFEDPAVRRACLERVAQEDGAAFFQRRDWEAALRRLLPHRVPGRLETPAEREAAIRKELAESRSLIEAHTGTPVVHLCFPWHVAGPTARRLAGETRYRAAFCGKVPGTPITLPGGDPMAIARVGEDYVERLPGRGRLALATIVGRKWTRRQHGGT